MEKTLGGDRLGSGKKMKVHLHGYERSTHDKGYLWRSTMSAGTLVPFLKELALPGDTFDINLDCDIKTHPTIGPLFGSYKVQLDVFLAPIRLYQGKLHNNKLGIGMNMASIKLPIYSFNVPNIPTTLENIETAQVNPSCILSYLGIRGFGNANDALPKTRSFNAVPLLMYWEIYKNYYANKQEEIGAVIHTGLGINKTVTLIEVYNPNPGFGSTPVPQNTANFPISLGEGMDIFISYTGAVPNPNDIILYFDDGSNYTLYQLSTTTTPFDDGAVITIPYNFILGDKQVLYWKYRGANSIAELVPEVKTFPLQNIDEMRENILDYSSMTVPFDIADWGGSYPYSYLSEVQSDVPNCLNTQEGLGIKTYQSDLFNNWLSTEWIDGAGGITELTSIDTSGGSFSLDTLNLSKKVYEMLNRIAVSGGTYDDWLDAVYAHDRYRRSESPMYMGGLIKELVFQEVVSNSESGTQPLGTLGGRGIMSKKHKGGYIHISVDEPSYIMGIISLTPRVDYSQGNDWDIHLKTMDDLHKPALDEIGFQELITEQMAWWDTYYDGTANKWVQKSAGKQPAWINYMTSVSKVYGNFAIPDNEMFMVLNRRYESELTDPVNGWWSIKDLTTYIDPVKFNHIFANTALDAQNFWAQIAVDMTARRKMSAKIMPNL